MLLPVSHPKQSPLLRLLLHRGQNAQQGLTIMECLVAVMLIGITIAMVTPPLLIATASRVQTRRGEQAQQVAQDEVDRINTLVQRGLHRGDSLPAVAIAESNPGTPNRLNSVGPPSTLSQYFETTRTADCPGTTRYNNQQLAVSQALPIDVDADCVADFYIQVIRSAGSYTAAENPATSSKTAQTARPARFDLGVRVYSALAQGNLTLGRLTNPPVPASLGLTIGQGQQATNPLSVVYKTLSWGERSEVLCQYATQATRAVLSGCN